MCLGRSLTDPKQSFPLTVNPGSWFEPSMSPQRILNPTPASRLSVSTAPVLHDRYVERCI